MSQLITFSGTSEEWRQSPHYGKSSDEIAHQIAVLNTILPQSPYYQMAQDKITSLRAIQNDKKSK